MIRFSSLLGAFIIGLTAGTTEAIAQTAPAPTTTQPVTTSNGEPSAADQQKASQMVENAAPTDRCLAPKDTFYILSYVAVKTDTGVEGFAPGQEVHLVEVHQPTHTLVVSDGHAQVEVPPSNLTNDINIASYARQKDQANQARIAGYMQREKEAYDKYEHDVAAATQKDLESRERQQQAAVAEQAKEENTPVASTAPPIITPLAEAGYYGEGGYGFGNPYSYFISTGTAAPTAAKAPATGAASVPNNVAAPAGGHAVGGGRGK